MVGNDGVMQRSGTSFGVAGVHIRAGIDEQRDNFLVAGPYGIVQCRAAQRIGGIHRDALLQQRPDAFGVACPDCSMQIVSAGCKDGQCAKKKENAPHVFSVELCESHRLR